MAVWNRFWPMPLTLSRHVAEELQEAQRTGSCLPSRRLGAHIHELKRSRIVHFGAEDPAPATFRDSAEKAFAAVEGIAQEFARDQHDYNNLYVTTNACNLVCGYCVDKHANSTLASGSNVVANANRVQVLTTILDRYVERKLAKHRRLVTLSFNGGEMLLHWKLVRSVVEHMERRYPSLPVEYGLNTNATLLSGEIAEFMARRRFRVHVSIDAHRRHHDKTRRDHSGCGSYDAVIAGINAFNSRSPKIPITGFQGTIDDLSLLDSGALFRMKRHGFVEARLAPNLFEITEAEAVRRARVMGALYERGLRHGLTVTDTFVRNMAKLLNLKMYRFFFTCAGLSGFPGPGLEVNIDKLTCSLLCSYLPVASVPYESLEGDVYSPRLWDAALRFVRARLDILLSCCDGCDILGVCRGSCVMMGLDIDNSTNPAACAYQREAWRLLLGTAYRSRSKAERLASTGQTIGGSPATS